MHSGWVVRPKVLPDGQQGTEAIFLVQVRPCFFCVFFLFVFFFLLLFFFFSSFGFSLSLSLSLSLSSTLPSVAFLTISLIPGVPRPPYPPLIPAKVDPAGYIPHWLVNMLAGEEPLIINRVGELARQRSEAQRQQTPADTPSSSPLSEHRE